MKKAAIICLMILFIAMFCMPGSVFAAVVNVNEGNNVTSIDGLQVDGYGTYDVIFELGSFDDLYGRWNYEVSGVEEAVAVMDAIIEAINTSVDEGEQIPRYVVMSNIPSGYLGYEQPSFEIPYGEEYSMFDTWYVGSLYTENDDDDDPDYGWLEASDTDTISSIEKIHWARLTVVPIPGAVWLLGSGLIGFAWARRKLKK